MSNNIPQDKLKVLITGAAGQLGQEVSAVFSKDSSYEVVSTDRNNLDITNPKQVDIIFENERPSVVVHLAAWTDVDGATKNPKEAMRVNGDGTKNVCIAAKNVGAKVFYISTNEVFNGKKTSPYKENDKPSPINSYGKSKLKGEKYCQEVLGKRCVIVRSSWLYGPASENNFPNKILKGAKEQGYLKVVDDEISTPTSTIDLARAIKKLVEKKTTGKFNLVNEGWTSRYGWAKEVLREKNLSIPIEAIKLADFERPSTPPSYSPLVNVKARGLGVKLRRWQEASKEYLTKIKNL